MCELKQKYMDMGEFTLLPVMQNMFLFGELIFFSIILHLCEWKFQIEITSAFMTLLIYQVQWPTDGVDHV